MAAFGLVHVVGGHQGGDALIDQAMQVFPKVTAGLRVDASGGFIQEQELGLVQQTCGECQALFPATRQRAGELVFALLQAQLINGLCHSFGALGHVVHARHEVEVFFNGEVFPQREALGHVAHMLANEVALFNDIKA